MDKFKGKVFESFTKKDNGNVVISFPNGSYLELWVGDNGIHALIMNP